MLASKEIHKRYHCNQIHVISQLDNLVTLQRGHHCNMIAWWNWVVMHSAVNHNVGNDDVTSWVYAVDSCGNDKACQTAVTSYGKDARIETLKNNGSYEAICMWSSVADHDTVQLWLYHASMQWNSMSLCKRQGWLHQDWSVHGHGLWSFVLDDSCRVSWQW